MSLQILYVTIFVISVSLNSLAYSFKSTLASQSRIISRTNSKLSNLYSTSPEKNEITPPTITLPSTSTTKKGFGKVKETVKEEVIPDVGTKTYDMQAKRGVPEYNIFVRPANGTDVEWIPVGSMTIPRDTKVNKVVFEVEDDLLKGAFKLYPKLKAYYELQGGKNAKRPPFDYGSCLKAFPDEPIEIITRPDADEGEKHETNFFKSWLSKITNPLDTDDLQNKNTVTLKQ